MFYEQKVVKLEQSMNTGEGQDQTVKGLMWHIGFWSLIHSEQNETLYVSQASEQHIHIYNVDKKFFTETQSDGEHPWWFRWQRICLQCRRPRFDPWVGKIPWRWAWLPTPVFWPGEFHRQRSLEGYSSWDRKELDSWTWLSDYIHTHINAWICVSPSVMSNSM